MRITPRLFLGVAAAAGLSVATAIAVYSAGDRWVSPGRTGKVAFPSLENRLKDVAALEITKGGKVLTIARKGDKWIAGEPYHYPVSLEQVRAVIVGLAEARLEEPKTRKSDKYKLLGLGDPNDEKSEAKRVRLLDGQNKEIVAARLGHKRYDAFGSGKAGTYVYRPGDPQTWLASLDLTITPGISTWVDEELFAIDQDKIRKITIEHPGEDAITIRRTDGEKSGFELAGLGDDARLKKNAPKADSVAEAFTGIDLEDLRKLNGEPAASERSMARLESIDGLTLTVAHRKDGSDHWITLSAKGDGNAGKRADALNVRVKGWEFKIPGWKADKLFRHRSDFLETS